MDCFRPKFCKSDNNIHENHHECSSRNVHYITTMKSWEAQISQARRNGQIVVVNFSASWSQPCRDIVKTYFELAKKYPCLVFLTVDVHELAELSSWWDIKATPTFCFLKNGRQVDKLVGADKVVLHKKAAAINDLISS